MLIDQIAHALGFIVFIKFCFSPVKQFFIVFCLFTCYTSARFLRLITLFFFLHRLYHFASAFHVLHVSDLLDQQKSFCRHTHPGHYYRYGLLLRILSFGLSTFSFFRPAFDVFIKRKEATFLVAFFFRNHMIKIFCKLFLNFGRRNVNTKVKMAIRTLKLLCSCCLFLVCFIQTGACFSHTEEKKIISFSNTRPSQRIRSSIVSVFMFMCVCVFGCALLISNAPLYLLFHIIFAGISNSISSHHQLYAILTIIHPFII